MRAAPSLAMCAVPPPRRCSSQVLLLPPDGVENTALCMWHSCACAASQSLGNRRIEPRTVPEDASAEVLPELQCCVQCAQYRRSRNLSMAALQGTPPVLGRATQLSILRWKAEPNTGGASAQRCPRAHRATSEDEYAHAGRSHPNTPQPCQGMARIKGSPIKSKHGVKY